MASMLLDALLFNLLEVLPIIACYILISLHNLSRRIASIRISLALFKHVETMPLDVGLKISSRKVVFFLHLVL